MNYKTRIYRTLTSDDTKRLGREFAEELTGGEVVFLEGSLGSGKTTFTKGLAEGLGVASRIISPTFVIVREHKIIGNKKGIETLYHLDLYRVDSEKALKDIDLKSIIQDKKGVVVIEWPDVAKKFDNRKNWDVSFEADENLRTIQIKHE